MSPKQPTRKKPTKTTLIETLRAILAEGSAGSQEEIKQALEQKGYLVNQSKISRLLRKLGAAKTTNDHQQIIYALSEESIPAGSKKILPQLITEITMNESLIIIHTTPGSASFIARLLDRSRHECGVLGSVAGDDTLFLAPVSTKNIAKTLESIKAFLLDE